LLAAHRAAAAAASAAASAAGGGNGGVDPSAAAAAYKVAEKELHETVVSSLRYRSEWAKSVTNLEAKVEGRERELSVLQNYRKSQPKVGLKRKRQRENAT